MRWELLEGFSRKDMKTVRNDNRKCVEDGKGS